MTHLITLTHPRSQAAEAFRTLRTNLTFSSLESPLTTLLVTSPSDDGDVESGKSITLANLAITFAQGGKKTILVDCDLRRPAQHELWNVKNDRGLSEFIQEGGDPVLQSVNVEGLLLLTSGAMPPAPADLIS
ncbi:MAG: CpsD/CapB family tyrosine-protein kinase, partial [Chloroflexi bacterium]|nr:CpsD/CapB family tyrosine-protein kinase [Chloroflexota bacterium]